MRRFRLSTLLLSVVIAALSLAVIELQGRLADRDRKVIMLKAAVRRQGRYLRVFATPGKERDDMLRRYEGLKGYFDMQATDDMRE
jgi:hypothetical protein